MDTRRIALVVLLAASLLVAAGCGGGGTAPSTGPATSEVAEDTGGQAADAPKTEAVPIGETAQAGDWTIKVTNVERAASAGGGSPSAGNELVVITFEMTNGTGEDQGIGPTSFRLVDNEGTEFTAAPTSDPTFIFNTQQPITDGETREILIAYDVKPAAGPFTWTFEPFGASSVAAMEFD